MDMDYRTYQESTLEKLRSDLNQEVMFLRQSIDKVSEGRREVALVITKLQEARLWAGEALKEMGYYERKEMEEKSKEENQNP